MADFSFEGLLGGINNAFGGGSSNYLDEYLTPDQKRMMQRNAMLAASAALLKAGGESTRRIGIGEALGEALQAGQGGYEKAQTGALTQMSLKQKMDEAKRAKELNARLAGIMGASATGEMESPQTTANQLMQAGRAAFQAGDFTRAFDFYKQSREVNPPDEVQGAPFEGTDAQGKPVLLQQMKSGVTRPVFGYGAKPEAAAAPIEVTGPDGKPMLVTPQRGGVYTPVVGYGPKQGAIGQPIEMTDAQGKPVMVQQMPDGSFRPVVGFTPKRAAPAADKAPRTQQVQLEDGTIGLINMDTGAVTRSTVGGVEVKGKSEAPVAFSEASRKLNNLKGNISAYKTEINSNKTVFPSEVPLPFGARIPLPTGEDTARLRGKYQSLLMGVKDLYELGALTGPDMGIIEQQLTNPASFAGMFTSRDAMREQIKVLEDMAGRAEENLSVTYKRKIPAASTSGIPAEPGARPADIEKIINQYRRTR